MLPKIFLIFIFLLFLGGGVLHLRHLKVLRLGVPLELQLLAHSHSHSYEGSKLHL